MDGDRARLSALLYLLCLGRASSILFLQFPFFLLVILGKGRENRIMVESRKSESYVHSRFDYRTSLSVCAHKKEADHHPQPPLHRGINKKGALGQEGETVGPSAPSHIPYHSPRPPA